jgi:dsDNA-specific endonuclease/ATPase MutS2
MKIDNAESESSNYKDEISNLNNIIAQLELKNDELKKNYKEEAKQLNERINSLESEGQNESDNLRQINKQQKIKYETKLNDYINELSETKSKLQKYVKYKTKCFNYHCYLI